MNNSGIELFKHIFFFKIKDVTPWVNALAAILSSTESVNPLKARLAVLSQAEDLARSPQAVI